MNELTIIRQDGCAYIDSREIAKAIGKRHDHLLRDIAGYLKIMRKVINPKFGVNDFFIESSYKDSIGRSLICYLISKMGCELVANKLTGEKGILFTTAYVKKFNEMEAAEREAEIKSYARPQLSEFNSAVRNVLSGMSYCMTKPSRVIGFLRGVYEPLGIDVQDELDEQEYLSATLIARLLGIYSETGRPHGHAVAAIISRFDDLGHHTIAVPYGLVGVMIRYDWSIVEKVVEWIRKNNKPRDVAYLDFFYHIHYDPHMLPFYDDDGDAPIYLDDDYWFDPCVE